MPTVQNKINDDQYKSKLPYPPRPTRPRVPSNPQTSGELRQAADLLEQYLSVDEPAYRAAKAAWTNDTKRLFDEFHADLAAQSGLPMSDKEAKLFAWAEQKGDNLTGIREVYEELVELLSDVGLLDYIHEAK